MYVSGFCCVCHVFPPLVSIFGLFPVLVSCHYELSMFQLCLSLMCNYPCILVLSFQFDFVWSTCDFPVYPVSLPCLVLPWCIKYYYLSLRPRLRVSCSSLVCAPWQNVCVCMCVCTCLCYIVRTNVPKCPPCGPHEGKKNSKNSKWCLLKV